MWKKRVDWSGHLTDQAVQSPPLVRYPPPTWTAPSAPGVAGNEVRFEQSKAAVFTGLNQAIATRADNRQGPVRRKRYSGRKINIDIKDGDIHNILRLLAKEGNINIVTSDEVKGKVTMHLKLVPVGPGLGHYSTDQGTRYGS